MLHPFVLKIKQSIPLSKKHVCQPAHERTRKTHASVSMRSDKEDMCIREHKVALANMKHVKEEQQRQWEEEVQQVEEAEKARREAEAEKAQRDVEAKEA